MISDLYPSNVTTKDKQVMTVDSFVIWQVVDPVKYLSSLNASLENAENRLENIVYNSVKTVLSATSQEEIISGRDGQLAKTITENTGTAMDAYGIKILSVETKKLDLPDSNKASVYTRMISERNNIAAGYTADGQYQYNLIKNETDRTRQETIAKANAEAEQIKAEGEAEYMRILSRAYNDESKADFYNYVRSLDALKTSLKGQNKTIILDENSLQEFSPVKIRCVNQKHKSSDDYNQTERHSGEGVSFLSPKISRVPETLGKGARISNILQQIKWYFPVFKICDAILFIHFPYDSAWIAYRQRIGRNISGHYTAGTNDNIVSDCKPRHDDSSGANPAVLTNMNRCIILITFLS